MLLLILTLLVGDPSVSPASPGQRSPGSACSTDGPRARTGHSLVYDPARKMVLLFGGVSADTTDRAPSSLWGWNGRRWSCLAADGPPGRTDASVAFDARRQRLVLYGGRQRTASGTRVLTDTWEWDGSSWTLADSIGPGPRVHEVMAYDNTAHAIVLIGGAGENDALHDRWHWDGRVWSRIDDPTLPPGIPDALLATPPSGRLTLITADPDSTDRSGNSFRAGVWMFRDNRWSRIGKPGPRFSPMAPAAATERGLLMLLGWEENRVVSTPQWSAGRWSVATEEMPSSRKGTAVAFDPARGRVVLFGGDDDSSILGDLWEWDGNHWLRRSSR